MKFSGRDSSPRSRAVPAPGPALARYGLDLTQASAGAQPLVGRQDAVAEIFELLLRWRHNNGLIVGRPGSGKTALITEIARRFATGQNPAPLGVRGLVQVDVRVLIAGASVRGQVEERWNQILKELFSYHGGLIAVLEDIPDLLAAASTSSIDLMRLLAPILESPEVPCLATASEDALSRDADLQRQLAASFQVLRLAEPGHAETMEVLRSIVPDLERHHGITIGSAAIEHAAHLARRYVKTRALPDSALSLLDQAAASVRLAGPERKMEATPEDVAGVAARWTGVPLQQLLDEEASRLARLEEILHRRVVGQDAAVAAAANAVRRARARLADPGRPVGVFLFLGPTGVGKTELARSLATFLFQEEAALVRIDMSEYMERHQVFRLIGAPPGYVGYAEGGQLTEVVRQRPYSVVLLDELEKAHPDVFNVLLQIMEDGRLTDGRGQTVDFRHTVIIMTSNCGSQRIVELSDSTSDADIRDAVMQEVRAAFKPEFLNRIDELIVFHRLSREEIRRVVDVQVARLRERLSEHGIELSLTAAARDWFAEQGYDVDYGARPLKRLMRRELEDRLALRIVAGELRSGQVQVDAAGGVLRVI